MHIDKYKTGKMMFWGPEYMDEEGISYDGAEQFLQVKFLNHCACGRPFENIKYVGKVLRHIHNLKELVWEKKTSYEDWEKEGEEIGSSDALYFAYYCLDELGLTEHGGSVPGWLTQKGIEFMEDAEELTEEGE